MGSVMLDAVNSFFAPQHTFRDATPAQTSPAHRSDTPTRTPTSMSASEQRASSSSAARVQYHAQSSTTTTTPPPTQHVSHASMHPTPPPRMPTQPPSPPLAAAAAPPSVMSQPSMQSTDNPTVMAQRPRPNKIKVRDLEHIQSFASQDFGAFSEIQSRRRSGSRGAAAEGPHYEISEMKVEHIIEMVAGLLTKITTTNDQQHEHLHRQPPNVQNGPNLSAQTSSVLAFHGKNVPSITILSYLSRINKYCPTSYEVFLSLLVYFDRMTERVNAGPMQSLRQANEAAIEQQRSIDSAAQQGPDDMEDVTATTPQTTQTATPPASGNMQKAAEPGRPGTPHSRSFQAESPPINPQPSNVDFYNLSHFFVVDSFNIHRLVIAGVTCASKFFSDIFYTNSRYAKVGGLPLPELNHLELQFLLLNDFRLSIAVEEIEAYGTMLVEFYAREVVAQQRAAEAEAMQRRSLSSASSSDSTSTVRAA